jgi:hypothetical protein
LGLAPQTPSKEAHFFFAILAYFVVGCVVWRGHDLKVVPLPHSLPPRARIKMAQKSVFLRALHRIEALSQAMALSSKLMRTKNAKKTVLCKKRSMKHNEYKLFSKQQYI